MDVLTRSVPVGREGAALRPDPAVRAVVPCTASISGTWRHAGVDEVARLMLAAVLRDLAHGLPLDREAFTPGAALDALFRGDLVRIAPTSGVDDARTFEVTDVGRWRVRDS
jgi:hypothetical protein